MIFYTQCPPFRHHVWDTKGNATCCQEPSNQQNRTAGSDVGATRQKLRNHDGMFIPAFFRIARDFFRETGKDLKRTLHERGTGMANSHVNSCSPSLASRECKWKPRGETGSARESDRNETGGPSRGPPYPQCHLLQVQSPAVNYHLKI